MNLRAYCGLVVNLAGDLYLAMRVRAFLIRLADRIVDRSHYSRVRSRENNVS